MPSFDTSTTTSRRAVWHVGFSRHTASGSPLALFVAVAFVFAVAPFVSAQSSSTPPARSGAKKVIEPVLPEMPRQLQTRERSAPTATPEVRDETKKAATPSATERAADVESEAGEGNAKKAAAKNADVNKREDETAPANSSVETEPETLDNLRARLSQAKSDAERAQLERSIVALLVRDVPRAEALGELRRLSTNTRFDPPFYYNLGNHLARLGDAGAAASAFRKAIDQRQGNYPRALNNLGVVLMRIGNWTEAEEAFLNALRQENFTYAEAHYNLGRLYDARGETELAVRQWRRALRATPDHIPATVLLAQALAADGDRGEALKLLGSVRPKDEAARLLIADARETVAGNRPPPVERAGTTNIAATAPRNTTPRRDVAAPPRSDANLSRARSLSRRTSAASRYRLDEQSFSLLQTARDRREAGRHEEAAALYRRVISGQRGGFPPAQLELGYALISLRRNTEAVAALEPLAARHGDEFPIVYYHLARLYEASSNLETAAANYTRAAVSFGDRNPQFLLDLSRVRERQNDYPAAVAAFELYIAANERNGTSIEWAPARLAELRAKATTVGESKMQAPKP